jgi:radical SAM protein with 4Fe4S-binding SPASM domain
MHFDLDYERHPIVVWELTRACDMHCTQCPMGADTTRSPLELSTYEGYKTIDQIAAVEPSRFVISGGDPLERDDVYQFVEYAVRRGLEPHVALSPTSSITQQAIAELARSGAKKIVVSIDDVDAQRNDKLRGMNGGFATTMLAMRWAREAGLGIEVNTLVARNNAAQLGPILELLELQGADAWNLYFLVPVGASKSIEQLTPDDVEQIFRFVDDAGSHVKIRLIEAPHYRRHRMQQVIAERQKRFDSMLENDQWPDFSGYAGDEKQPLATHDARGIVFISHSGEVRPSEFLPISAGNIRYRSLGAIFRGGDLFVALREPSNLKGKCGRCEFARICGGSRARSFAATGDVFATDPLCAYEPGTLLGH